MRMTQLKTIADIQTGPFGSQLHKEDYVETGTPIVTVEHLGNRVFTEQNLPRVSDSDKARLIKYTLSTGDIVFSRVGSVDRCSYVDKSHDGWMFSGRCLRVRPTELVDSLYLYYYFCLEETKQFVRNIAVGATMPSINTKLLGEVEIALPDLNNQKRIAAVLSSLDDKIENNQKLNDNLEAAMRALFEHFVVSNEAYDFDEAIDDKIDFINGLAMQNYRPEKDETPIPVIKIRELSQGYCDENSEFCSNHIDKSHIIQNGDLVFSWSGSLQASFWTSQTAGLNQHLFKVQSDEYPLWFVYEWVTFHLLNFQRIAENKGTTFGHIKREDLHNAKIKSVGIDEINKLNNLFQPLLNTIIANSTELHSLMNYQRVLLARLSR